MGRTDGAWDDDDEAAEFFDDRRLLPKGSTSKRAMERPHLRPRARRRSLRPHPFESADWLIAGGCFLAALLAAGLFRGTSNGTQNEILESPWYQLTWLVFPLVVAAATARRPFTGRPPLFSASLVGPLIGVVYYQNAFVFDSARGASFAGYYAAILTAQGAACWLVARITAAALSEGVGQLHQSSQTAADPSGGDDTCTEP